MTARVDGPADKLVGLTLLGEWEVVDRVRRNIVRSGEPRTSCYRAQNAKGEQAFVKAFDFWHEDVAGDPMSLERMVREFNHEHNVHVMCKDKRLARVTRIYDAGKVLVDGYAVHFLVCEYAPQSLGEALPPGDETVPAWQRFDALRRVAAGLVQLHGVDIAHQDIKPSNAVAYDCGNVKVTDLGSSSCRSLPPAPHDDFTLCGQPNYAPYELLYDHVGNWMQRRIGCDMFLMGNLAYTSFAGHSITNVVLGSIAEELRHTSRTADFQLALPYLIEMHNENVPLFLRETVPAVVLDDLTRLILSMCHPDPTQRGAGLNGKNAAVQYSLQRCVTLFDLMARKCRLRLQNVA